MKPRRFTEEQIIGLLKQTRAGMKLSDSVPYPWHQRINWRTKNDGTDYSLNNVNSD